MRSVIGITRPLHARGSVRGRDGATVRGWERALTRRCRDAMRGEASGPATDSDEQRESWERALRMQCRDAMRNVGSGPTTDDFDSPCATLFTTDHPSPPRQWPEMDANRWRATVDEWERAVTRCRDATSAIIRDFERVLRTCHEPTTGEASGPAADSDGEQLHESAGDELCNCFQSDPSSEGAPPLDSGEESSDSEQDPDVAVDGRGGMPEYSAELPSQLGGGFNDGASSQASHSTLYPPFHLKPISCLWYHSSVRQ
jgi:hypothetical protein